MAIISIESEEQFSKEVLQASQPVMVDFWAPWCGFCKRLSPVIDRIEQRFGEKIKVVKVNVDDNKELTQKYDIDAIPAVFLFQNGEVSDIVISPPSEMAIIDWLTKYGAL
ncbi:thioredoxin [Candidatus Methanomassiliicoccus intestinalis]|uniref:thioredoxin n=1 Tax=Candidatus Methanomassiliicoccus intestinalis TaxID=1406512 RepID=UPI0037DC2EFE